MTAPPHAHDVSALQHFLLDVARRYVVAESHPYPELDELLACAAALDYVLLVCREHEDDHPDPSRAVLEGIAETIERSLSAALGFIASVRTMPDRLFRDFESRHAGSSGIFPVFGRLRAEGYVRRGDLAFEAVTLANDLDSRRIAG